jgi:superfamily II DNA or RNA helicase
MPPITENQIIPHTPVRHSRQPSKVGILTGMKMKTIILMAEVSWGTETAYESVDILELFNANEDKSFENLVRKKLFERIDSLRSLLTFEKLSGSLSNVIYSMQTAEIDFYAHQFIPVLKFVNAPLGRLLIADEVGLGKTIEAGLIWTECRARYQARRLLVICPPTLVPKWIRELRERFAIEAEFADAKGLEDHFKRFQKKGPSHSFALVASYPSIRPRRRERELLQPWLTFHGTDVQFAGKDDGKDWNAKTLFYRSLLEWDGANPFLDLAIFDEAHLMKNTATANHLVGDVISSSSQAVLALSATPLTTKTRDLFALLKLVDPDLFRDEATFNDLSKRNVPAVRLVSELSKAKINKEYCLNLLDQIPDSAVRDNLEERIRACDDLDRMPEEEKVELLGKAGRLNELASFLTRTRKVEIKEHKATREPVTLDVRLNKQELALYNGMISLIRSRVRERGEYLSLFHLIAPALSMTSCLPVMAQKMRSGESRWGDMEDLASLESAYSDSGEESDFIGENQDVLTDDFSWIPNYDFEANDTKYLKLRDELLRRSPDEKVIIFAFFKDTLRYLQRRLEADGIKCLYVSGDIKDRDERYKVLNSFEDPKNRILLCSEVAAEGVDLQFCRVLVNYDLPWNPMRVEQRIGRIDRIGQQANSIVIINFHVHGTIDGTIFSQLYDKIGIFHDNIGDLEGIMGGHINKLTNELLANDLTPEQQAEKVRLIEQAIARERNVIAEIDEESDSLLGLRSYLQDSVTKGRSLGRFIKPAEVRLFVDEFFAETYVANNSCTLNWDSPAEGCLSLGFSYAAMSDFEDFLARQSNPWPKGFKKDTRTVSLTFDPAVHERLKRKHSGLVLASHIHPFVAWITSTFTNSKKKWHPASGISVRSNAVISGVYLFAIMRITIEHSVLSKSELLFRAIHVENENLVPPNASEVLLNQSVEEGSSWVPAEGFPEASDQLEELLHHLSSDCGAIQETFEEELELRINTKRSQIESHLNRQIETQRKRLFNLETSGRARPQDIQGTRTRIRNLEIRLEEERERLNADEDVIPSIKRIACGLIKVTN